ncbi:MAG TPA: zinc ribbon domain-containing protein [Longimicrobiales bacterium]|nr:zinc ribbon domain-containing protein [Longimicrobiales bacterium]
MELTVAVIIGLVAAIAVVAPLLRGDRGAGRTSAGRQGAGARSQAGVGASAGGPDDAAPASPDDRAAAAAETAGVASATAEGEDALPEDPIEREILRYRAAVRAGTVCRRCRQANPEGSRYCSECGTRIAVA